MANLSDEDVKRLADECLADSDFINRFTSACSGKDIPDPTKEPEAHRAFIAEVQAKLMNDSMAEKVGEVFEDDEGTWTYTLPKGVFVIKATDVSGQKKIFINICESDAIAEPMPMNQTEIDESGMKNENLHFRVPISIGPPRVEKDKAGKASMVYDIAVNPLTLEKCQADPEFKRLVCAMCLYGLKQKHEQDLNTDQYKQPNIKCKGNPVPQRVRLNRQAGNKNAFNNEINIGGNQQKSNIDVKTDIAGFDSLTGGAQEPKVMPKKEAPPKKNLIEVIGEEKPKTYEKGEGLEAFYKSTKMDEEDEDAEVAADATPKRDISIVEEGQYDWSAHARVELNSYWRARAEVPAQLVVSIHLPELQASIKEANVDINAHRVVVYGIDDEELTDPFCEVEFKFPVDDECAKAKFLKKKKTLVLTLPVKLPDEVQQREEVKQRTREEEEKERAEQKAKDDVAEAELQALRAKNERLQKETEAQQTFNKQLIDHQKALQEGSVPPEMQKAIDEMPPQEAQTFLARLLDGKKREDHVDALFEKLPPQSIKGLIASLRTKLGLTTPQAEKDEEKAQKKKMEEAQRRMEKEEEERETYGFDKMGERLFDVKIQNRFLFALDL